MCQGRASLSLSPLPPSCRPCSITVFGWLLARITSGAPCAPDCPRGTVWAAEAASRGGSNDTAAGACVCVEGNSYGLMCEAQAGYAVVPGMWGSCGRKWEWRGGECSQPGGEGGGREGANRGGGAGGARLIGECARSCVSLVPRRVCRSAARLPASLLPRRPADRRCLRFPPPSPSPISLPSLPLQRL